MILIKHNIYETPPSNKKLLILVDTGGSEYIWTEGYWDESEGGWNCPFGHTVDFNVIEWYKLPKRKK